MFGNLELPTFQVEIVLANYLLRGDFQPRGDMLTYLNDRRRPFIPFGPGDMYPLSPSRQVKGMKQEVATVSKSKFYLVSVPDPQQAEDIHLLASMRAAVFYIGYFAVHGQIHVNADSRNDDLLDDTKDFFALSEASIYPLQAVASAPTRQSPVVFINRSLVESYHVPETKS